MHFCHPRGPLPIYTSEAQVEEEWESLEPAIRELVLTDATASAEAAQ